MMHSSGPCTKKVLKTWVTQKGGWEAAGYVLQWLGCVRLLAAHQAFPSLTISQSLLRFMSVELVRLSNHLTLCRPLLLLEKTLMLGKMEGKRRSRQAVGDRLVGTITGRSFQKKQMVNRVKCEEGNHCWHFLDKH